MYCPLCGTPNNDTAVQCSKCSYQFQETAPPGSTPISVGVTQAAVTDERALPQQPNSASPPQPHQSYPPYQTQHQWAQPPYTQSPTQPPSGNDAFSTLIPYKNTSALVAYYLAVFSLIPCAGLFLGTTAFILGFKGLQFAKQHPEAKGQAHAWVGIILGGLCGLVNIVMLVAAVIIPLLSHHT